MSSKLLAARKLFIIGLAIVVIPALAACNTVKGAGKDIEKGGEAIQDGAEDVQDDMAN
jgi:predicted small secreted protein